MIYIVLTLIVFIIVLYYKYNNDKKIIFYTSNQLYSLLYNILYDYYNCMSDENLKIRGIKDINVYIHNLDSLFYTSSYYEQKILRHAIHKADKRINNLNYTGFCPYKLKNIPWLIGFSLNDKYEFGLPHTQDLIIILNRNDIYLNLSDLITLLIHERIHIYQKLYPDDVNKFLKYYNFKKVSKKTNIDRVNPDTDDFIYKRSTITNQIFECKIMKNEINNTLKVVCTNDDSSYEHPYEFMAYMISESVH